ncbi:MAG: hypothetical protein ACSHWX_14830 [Maritalea sp.]
MHFFPIALFVGVLELVWPFLIYLTTCWVLWNNVRRNDPPAPKPEKPSPFEVLFVPTPPDNSLENGLDHAPQYSNGKAQRAQTSSNGARNGQQNGSNRGDRRGNVTSFPQQ